MKSIFGKLIVLLMISLSLFSCSENVNRELTQKIRGHEDRRLTYTLEPEEIWVGVPISLNLYINGNKGDDVIFTKAELIELPEYLRLIDARADDNHLKLILKAEKTGEYTMPPLSILFENPQGEGELLTRPMTFSVLSLVEEGSENQLSGLSPSLKIGFLPSWQILLFTILIILLGLFLFWFLHGRHRKKNRPPEPIWTTLERDLYDLQRDNKLMDGDWGRFYDLTSSLVKKNLDKVYGQNTGEKTREEFMGELVHSSSIDSEIKLWLSHFFERADLVRFARAETTRETALNDLDEVVRFTQSGIKKAMEPLPAAKSISHGEKII